MWLESCRWPLYVMLPLLHPLLQVHVAHRRLVSRPLVIVIEIPSGRPSKAQRVRQTPRVPQVWLCRQGDELRVKNWAGVNVPLLLAKDV